MKLYLIQHGDSLDKEINQERPLSEKGSKDVERLANFISTIDIRVSSIFHSGKLRAQQTAEILARNLNFKKKIESHAGMDPLDPVDPIMDKIKNMHDDIILAGHLPFMEKLVSNLLIEDESTKIANFEPGSMICLERQEDNHWVINWMLRPELFYGH